MASLARLVVLWIGESRRTCGTEYRARSGSAPALRVRSGAALPARADRWSSGFGADWTRDNTWVPIVMQWNFWLSTHWFVFGEPGGAFHFTDNGRRDRADFTLYGSARLRFSDRVTLTFRVGHPALAVGLSFLL